MLIGQEAGSELFNLIHWLKRTWQYNLQAIKIATQDAEQFNLLRVFRCLGLNIMQSWH
jgi:hypothetical protein